MSIVVGDDGIGRCAWGDHPDLRVYHDTEWGRPVSSEVGLFERLSLEAFQSGLSWLVILRKRDGFRSAFAGFDPEAVAQFGDAEVERLLADEGIVRNRAKIEATIANARAVLELGGEFVPLVHSFAPVSHERPADGPPGSTAESAALSKGLKKRGFRFVGPTTAYALMQATGLVNDHVVGCDAGDTLP